MKILIASDGALPEEKIGSALKKLIKGVENTEIVFAQSFAEARKICADEADINRRKPGTGHEGLYIQCYGSFDVFMYGKPVHFERSKAKELLAYLVDRRGASVNTGQICGILWPERVVDESLYSQCRTVISSLKKTLGEIGVCDILLKSRNSLSIDVNGFWCDYYEFLENPKEANVFYWEYMSQYEWAEVTAAELWRMREP